MVWSRESVFNWVSRARRALPVLGFFVTLLLVCVSIYSGACLIYPHGAATPPVRWTARAYQSGPNTLLYCHAGAKEREPRRGLTRAPPPHSLFSVCLAGCLSGWVSVCLSLCVCWECGSGGSAAGSVARVQQCRIASAAPWAPEHRAEPGSKTGGGERREGLQSSRVAAAGRL